ncbi:hypothetical protein RclHR1_01330004 [Rhizophagus clarus]|uniref:Uncharacterized protein n=1 Tax=Rhizophagus clarus TaxID=94130 RepID=A0A2Z6Q9K5_9GLOM|nr:hypothetical protein RclHR1_01330004 [Rhizophagus clarus]GES79892.1 hypothetical protein GLOIN_2v1731410 [Rhizophagus clarus]
MMSDTQESSKKAEQECNVIKDLINQSNFRNITFRYFHDTDDLSVYFVEGNCLEDHCVDVTTELLISYDINDKAVAFHVERISRLLPPTLDLSELFNDNPPNPIYNKESDIFKVNFYSIPPTNFQKTEMEDIEVGRDNMGNIACLLFHNASNRIAEELSPEERELHEKRKKKEYERLNSWAKSIIIRKYINSIGSLDDL